VNLGTENRAKLYAAVGLGVLALLLVSNWIFSGSSAPASAPLSAAAPAGAGARTAPGSGTRKISAAPRSLDPTLRYAWLKGSEDTKYEGTGRNIFRAEAEIPPPKSNGATDVVKNQPPPGPPAPPPPPPITLKFFGFANKPGEPKKIFLSQGEDIFVASEGEIVDRRYKVLRISPMSVEIEDVLNNNRQSIPLTQG
jgi:hypothetical protein